ncbi:hypothetical protein [Amaricoccus macauensis]|uniref:hypothetical protein n=1 Tax=Amaricoccus macauensis TaxID=57001 RepID=UPI003C7C4E3E
MELLTNGLLIAATLFAGGYCWVLSRRVRELKSLDKGLGKSIVTLTRQIEVARTTLEESRNAAKISRNDLTDLLQKADEATQRVAEATEAAQDIERGLRFQISQAGDRRRNIDRDPDDFVSGPNSALATQEAARKKARQAALRRQAERERAAREEAEVTFNKTEPAEGNLAFKVDGEEVRQSVQNDVQAGSEHSREAPAARKNMNRAVAPRFDPEEIAKEEGEARPAGPTADEVEPWQPKRAASSVLRAGADLLTLKPLKPKTTKVAELPKPKSLPPLGNPLRSKSDVAAIDDEDELLEALSMLAAGGKR